MIELKAIIGKRESKIGDYNSSSIVSHLGVIGKTYEDNGYDTNSDRLSGFFPRDVKLGKGKNVYIHADLIDLDLFYRYLSNSGFVLRDSRIKVLSKG